MELFYLEKFFRSVINIRGNIASNINDRAIMIKMCHFILQLSKKLLSRHNICYFEYRQPFNTDKR